MSAPPSLVAFLGGWELAVIALVALLLFGTRLPKLARSLGQSVNEFKTGLDDGKKEGGERREAADEK